MDYPKSDQTVGLINGKFSDGDAVAGVAASRDPAAWANLVSDELINIIVAAGIVPDEADNGQVIDALTSMFASKNGFTAGGTVSAITGTLAPAITAYAAKLRVTTTPPGANTITAPTLNLNGLGAKIIKKRDSSGAKVALIAGDFNASGPFDFEYDGVDFILLNPDISRLATQGSVQVQAYNGFTAGGTVSAITGTLAPAITAYTAKLRVTTTPPGANTITAPTLNLNGLGAKIIKKRDSGGVKVALIAGDFNASGPFDFEYDGVDFILLNPIAVPSSGASSVRQTVLTAAVDGAGLPNFISIGSGLAVNIAATAVPIVVSFAAGFDSSGSVDKIGRIAADTTIPGLTASQTCYLYVDRDVNTGAITYGHTILAPAYGYGIAKSTVAGQHTYRIDEGIMYVGNGSVVSPVQRVFLGEAVTGASTVTSVVSYALRGEYVSDDFAVVDNTQYSKNHNIGLSSVLVAAYFVFSTTQGGWAVGDMLPLPFQSQHVDTENDGGVQPWGGKNSCGVTVAFYGSFSIQQKNSSTRFSLTIGNVRVRIYAKRGW